ncbi:hypothetical protein GN244_ATG01749 [Phytophthora infestans]|uniref:Uncharacterized protein n=1 Tax=Phytophthora infestans TaxID=4787 RepID=A0A833SU29_PHYIN|nr:hypothetical protein GN244_ATG01749 [Phytophthora infestans]
MAKSDASRLRKKLPWLKSLQASLNNDESSDSSSQLADVAPKKSGITPEKAEGGEARRRNPKKRVRRREGDNSDDTASGKSEYAKERKRRQQKKVVKARRKRSIEEAKKGKSPAELAKAKAAALRGQRMQKLYAMRVSSGEHERMATFKLKRQESAEVLRAKDRIRMRAIRAARSAPSISAGAEADIEDEGEPRKRPRSRPAAGKDIADKMPKNNLRRTSIPKAGKPNQTEPAALAAEKAPDSVKSDAPRKTEVKIRAIAKIKPSELRKRDEDRAEALVPSATPSASEEKDGHSWEAESKTTIGLPTSGESAAAMKEDFFYSATTDNKMKVTCEASECAKSGQESQERPDGADTDAIKNEPSWTTDGASFEPGEPSKPEIEVQVKTEPLIDAEATAELVKNENKEETRKEPSESSALAVKTEDEKKPDEEKLLLDEVPIPRKAPKQQSPAPPLGTESFKIPKRTFAKVDVARQKAPAQVGLAGITEATGSGVKRSGQASIPATSPPSSSNLPKDEPARPQRKRTKNPVPVKKVSLSAQDRASMRLSRKRNSIFMAAAELAALTSDIKGSKKTGSGTRMMGYEVYDVDGETLSDLVPRLNCATKREMAVDRESYAASFFGVSREAPKAKREPRSVYGECDETDHDTRKMNCYEELSFERPEDREFYQRKLYGTAFVPQNVRGWITLIVRNARFERKATGIRFNQDRDREAFAATLSQRYTLKKSVPRCDIPRENWQKLMRNEPATVYLHYYNREDAGRAAQVFRDDLGQPLQIRWELKAGSRIRRCSSLAARSTPQLSPRRSCSSERSAPEPSPLPSQNGSARNTPVWRRERDATLKSDHRYSRYDRGAPPAQWPKGESREGRYGPSLTGNKRSHERRSRSRSGSVSFHRQHYESSGQVNNRAGPRSIVTSNQQPPTEGNRARTDGGAESSSSAVHNDVGSPAQKRARMLPRRSPLGGQDRDIRENARGSGLRKELMSSSEAAPNTRVRNLGGNDSNRGERRSDRSPPRRWQKDFNNSEPRGRRNSFTTDLRDRSEGPPAGQHRFNYQQHNRDPVEARPRSRSRSRTSLSARGGYDGNVGDRNKERRGSREFGRGGGYNPNARETCMHSDRERGGRHNGRSGNVNSRAP